MKSERVLWLFAAGAGLTVVVLVLTFVLAVSAIRQEAREQSTHVVRGALHAASTKLESLAVDNAWWDEGIEKMMLKPNLEWIDHNFALPTMVSLDVESVIVLDGHGRPTYGYVGKDKTRVPIAAVLHSIKPLIEQARTTPVDKPQAHSSPVIMANGHLWFFAVSGFAPVDMPRRQFQSKPRGAMVFGHELSGKTLSNLAARFGIEGLQFSTQAPTDDNLVSLGIHNDYTGDQGWLTWHPPDIGRRVTILGLTLLPLLMLALGFGYNVFLRLVRVVKDLNQSLERNRRQHQLLESKNRLLEKLAQGQPLAEVLGELVASVTALLPDTLCVVWKLDQKRRAISLISSNGASDDIIELASLRPAMQAILLEGRTSELDLTDETQNDADRLAKRDVTAYRHLHVEPVCSAEGEILGGILVFRMQADRLHEDSLEMLRTGANLASITFEQKANAEQLELLAYNDTLTGLLNRYLFRRLLETRLQEAVALGQVVAVMFVDLDQFKRVNDTLGHDAGDQLIVEVARRIRETLMADDLAARQGGDEFTILTTCKASLSAVKECQELAQRLLEAISQPILLEGETVAISGSIGIALSNMNSAATSDLLKRADMALYRAKGLGRSRFCFFDETVERELSDNLAIENALQTGMENNEFHTLFQPIIDLENHCIAGAEALLRWNSSLLGPLSPAQFIPVAESSGRICELGYWVFRDACRALAAFRRQCDLPLTMSINLSARQFQLPDLAIKLEQISEDEGVPTQDLQLEITESVLMEDSSLTHQILEELRQRGFRIAIDDFGTGYSSLSYLKRFPASVLKIDRDFITHLSEMHWDRALADAIVAMAHRLHLKVVAEGIETIEQLNLLRINGCNYGQGFLFARPLPLEDLIAYAKGGVEASLSVVT